MRVSPPTTERTPLTVDAVPLGTRHKIQLELTGYEAVEETVDIPKDGHLVSVLKALTSATGKIIINSTPGGAEIWINGALRGRAPITLSGIDMSSTKQIELRLDHYEPFRGDLVWRDRRAAVNAVLQPTARR